MGCGDALEVSGSMHSKSIVIKRCFTLLFFNTKLTFDPHSTANKVVCRLQRLEVLLMKLLMSHPIIYNLAFSAGL